jgi:hypothetical protein
MTTLDWPTARHFQPSDMRWGARVPTSSWQAFYSGQSQSVAHAGQRIALALTLPPVRSPLLAAEREAFLTSLAASGNWVRLGHFGRPRPLGNAAADSVATVSANAVAGANSISVAGVRAADNLLTGASFELDANVNGLADGWGVYSNGTTGVVTPQVTTDHASHGTKCQLVVAAGLAATSADRAGITQTVNVSGVQGQTLHFSADTFCHVPGTRVVLYVDFGNGGGYLSSANSAGTQDAGPFAWTRRVLSAPVPATATYAVFFVWMDTRAGGAGYAELYVDAARIGVNGTTFVGFPSLAAGDVLGVGSQLLQVAYPGATLNDAGAGVVPLVLPLRVALTAGAAVTLARPTGTFQVTGSDYGSDYSAALVQQGVELQLLEVFA